MTIKQEGGNWLVSARALITTLAAVVTILTALTAVSAWCVGLYTGLSNRVTVLETNDQYMREDVKEIKEMLSQLIIGSGANRRASKEQ